MPLAHKDMAIDTKSVSQLIAEFQKLQAKDAITPGRDRGQINIPIYAAPCCPSCHGPVPVLSLKKKIVLLLLLDMT